MLSTFNFHFRWLALKQEQFFGLALAARPSSSLLSTSLSFYLLRSTVCWFIASVNKKATQRSFLHLQSNRRRRLFHSRLLSGGRRPQPPSWLSWIEAESRLLLVEIRKWKTACALLTALMRWTQHYIAVSTFGQPHKKLVIFFIGCNEEKKKHGQHCWRPPLPCQQCRGRQWTRRQTRRSSLHDLTSSSQAKTKSVFNKIWNWW